MKVTHVLGSIGCINTCCPFSIHAGCIEWHIHVIYTGNTMYSSFLGVFAIIENRGEPDRVYLPCIIVYFGCICGLDDVLT